MDFGGLKEFKEWLEHMFDHTLLVAEDDPQLDKIVALGWPTHTDVPYNPYHGSGELLLDTTHKELLIQQKLYSKPLEPNLFPIADIRVVPAVGCERFAELAFDRLSKILAEDLAAGTLLNPTVRVKSVEVFEHAANSAIVERN
jgi:6-pyruvoyltetrahydropterin/6-carboxytetrahydropterin synthase